MSVQGDRSFVQLGGEVDLTVVVTNVGTSVAEEVSVVDTVPGEFDVLGVPILDGLVGQNLITVGNSEQIVWSIGQLDPGSSMELPWFAQAVKSGDFAADNVVVAASTDQVTDSASRTYLGGSTAPGVENNHDRVLHKVVKRVVHYRTETVPDTSSAGAAGGAMPFTGMPALTFVALGIVALLAGALLLGIARGRRRIGLALLCVFALTMAACVGSSEDGSVAQGPGQQTSPTPTPTVLGNRLHNHKNDPGGGRGNDRVKGNRIRRNGAATGGASTTNGTQLSFHEVLVPVVTREVVTVPGQAPVPLTSSGGENTLTFSWDEASRSVTTATSSLVLGSADASIRVDQNVGDEWIANHVTLTNVSDHDLQIDGRLILDVAGGTAAHLTSAPLSETIVPGASINAEFRYVLPTGDYTAVPSFEAS